MPSYVIFDVCNDSIAIVVTMPTDHTSLERIVNWNRKQDDTTILWERDKDKINSDYSRNAFCKFVNNNMTL